MAYIGRDTDKISNVEVLDNITFDGSSSYTLQKGGSNFTPSSANTLLVSIDGVVQAGNFTVSGSTIDFGTAVAGTSTCDFILHYGIGLITTVSDGTVTTAKLADSSVTAAKITDSTITAAKLASGTVQNQSAFKNIIINGDMSIAQRGTSESGVGASDVYLIDRFQLDVNATPSARFTMSQDTDVPTGQGFSKSLKLDCTTAQTSYSSSQLIAVVQRIEGQNLQYLKYGTSSAQSLTLSFWVKSNKTGTYTLELDQAGNGKDYSQTYTISSANTWEKKTLTFDGDTATALANDNTEELEVNFWLAASSDFTSGTLNTSWNSTVNANRVSPSQVNIADSTANEWYITGVQLEAGTTASDFEFLPYDVNLQRCQRYYYVHATGNQILGIMWWYQDQVNNTIMHFPVEMRTSPSASAPSGTNNYRVFHNGSVRYFSGFSGLQAGSPHATTIDSGLTGSGSDCGRVETVGSGKMLFSAEL